MEKKPAHYITVLADHADQRIDNFLITYLKNMPKTHIYRILRKGEIRVNKKRIKPSYRLQVDDHIRLPPMQLETLEERPLTPPAEMMKKLSERILFENDQLLILNKPAGIPVHGGHQVKLGIIELMRCMYPALPQLELAHRLDADTSGCLILAKKRSALRELHQLLRTGGIQKTYWALTQGHWQKNQLTVEAELKKNQLKSGERIVKVDKTGKHSRTVFRPLKVYSKATWVEALLETGRTHQIRVHAQFTGHPIAGDEKYGDKEFNKIMRQLGVKRLFLHAYSIEFTLSTMQMPLKVEAPLEPNLLKVLKALE